MNTHILIPCLLFIFSGNLFAQDTKQPNDPCDCAVAFKDMVNKLESNYIGLKQMQVAGKADTYSDRKQSFAQKSAEVKPENCTEFLNEFLDAFEDGHLSVFERPKYSEEALLGFEKDIKEAKLGPDRLAAGQSSIKKAKHNIAGNWTDGQSKFIIFEVEGNYHAYIQETTKEGAEVGELKAIFRPQEKGYACTYYSYAYSPMYIRGDVYKDGQLLVAGHVIWQRVEASFRPSIGDAKNLKAPSIEAIDENSTLIRIPSFIVDYKVFNAFIKDHESLIKNATNLVIDIRGNRGGNGIYFPLIEMYATQDMEGGQGLVLASNDNLAYFERQMKYAKKIFEPVVKRIQENAGEIVDGPLYPGRKFKIRSSKIKRVAILTDHACASAAESFIIHSRRASTKVKTFGSPTAGMIDYTSVNALRLDSGNQNIYFGYPTSTLHKEIPENGFNKTGMLPDVPIEKQVKNKIAHIIDYLNN